jgi:menaquinone-specific isochorismate synthase
VTFRAIIRPLSDVVDHVPDLNDVARGDGVLFVKDGVGLAGRGEAHRVDVDDATRWLASLEVHSSVDGVTPVAVGTVPFRPGAPAELVVPRMTVGKGGCGDPWVVVVLDDAAAPGDVERWVADALEPTEAPIPTAHGYTLSADVSVDRYLAAVAAARDAVRRGDLTKAVIARPVTVTSSGTIDVHAVLLRLKLSFGSSYRYSVDGLVGASPELLVEIDGEVVRSHPLAGTAPRSGDPLVDRATADALAVSEKNRIEHRVVIDVVHDTLLPWASYLDWEPEPSIVSVANVLHLGTRMEGMLSQPAPSVVELVRALSPTPALGGHPRDRALALIERVEGFDRGRYGGAVGWVDARGNGTWAVAIRNAELSDDRRSARLVAGGGIVADSEPLAELAETQAKLQAMLSAIVRP